MIEQHFQDTYIPTPERVTEESLKYYQRLLANPPKGTDHSADDGEIVVSREAVGDFIYRLVGWIPSAFSELLKEPSESKTYFSDDEWF